MQLSAVPDGARLPDTVTPKGRTATNLSRGQDILYFTVSESSGARGWLDGLRALGGTEMPIAEDLLGLLPRLLVLVTLLWSLQPREGDALSESDTVVLARNWMI